MLGQIQVFSIRGVKRKLQCLLLPQCPLIPPFSTVKEGRSWGVLLEILGGVVLPGGQFND